MTTQWISAARRGFSVAQRKLFAAELESERARQQFHANLDIVVIEEPDAEAGKTMRNQISATSSHAFIF